MNRNTENLLYKLDYLSFYHHHHQRHSRPSSKKIDWSTHEKVKKEEMGVSRFTGKCVTGELSTNRQGEGM